MLLMGATDPSWRAWYQPVLAVVVFPMMVYFAASRPIGALGRRICVTIGRPSYAVYVLHTPFGRTAEGLAGMQRWRISTDLADFALLAGFVFVAWAADLVFDRPVRRALARMFVKPRTAIIRANA